MPSVVCESAGVNAALRESLSNQKSNLCSSSSNHLQNDDNKFDNILVNSVESKSLLNKIHYEEINNFSNSVLKTLKSKYVVIKPTNNESGKSMKPMNGNCGGDNDTQLSLSQNNAIKTAETNGGTNEHGAIELPAPKQILFPRESIEVGWKNGSRRWHIGAGMLNVGNTCYMNATLQALFHVPSIAHWLWSDSEHRDRCEEEFGIQDGCIICSMAKTLKMSQNSQSAIRPYMVYTKLKIICKHLIIGRQEDAHEFLRYLIESMEKAYLYRYPNKKEFDQYTKETTPLNQILGGYLKSVVRCLSCDHLSTTFQHFEDLLLDIRKADTIEDALDGYFSRERLEDMGYKCEACKKKVSATKQFMLERAPISLCIQLKRFSLVGGKITKNIAIKPRLDLSKYISAKKPKENLTYRLVSMVTHLGASQHCGHYTAIGLTETGTYYQFDDSYVSSISLQNVINTNAYIIFYELETLPRKHTESIDSGNQINKCLENSGKNNYNNQTKQNNCTATSASSTSNSPNNKLSETTVFDSSTNKVADPRVHPILFLRNGDDKSPSSGGKKLVNINYGCKTNENGHSLSPNQSQKSPVLRTSILLKNSSGVEAISNENNDNKNSENTENQISSMKKQRTNEFELPSPVLASMPLLCSPVKKVNGCNDIIKNEATSTVVSGNDMQSKRLVPYESESDEDILNPSELKRYKTDLIKEQKTTIHDYDSIKTDKTTMNGVHINAINGNNSNDSKIILKRSFDSELPSPVVKSKTGFWQVTNLSSNGISAIQSDKKITNPFSSPTNTINNSNGNIKSNLSNGDKLANGAAVSDLDKFSHRGYGAPVLSWNGDKSELDKEISDDVRNAQKREIKQDEENEMDRGRQKKVKVQIHGPDYNANDNCNNPGYNVFQEHQNAQHDCSRRWDSPSINRTYHRNGYRPHFYKKKFVNNYKFNARSHYQRTFHHGKNNCASEFYGRDS